MKALSVRQPWAWLIIHGGKDIENRRQRMHYRGPLAIVSSLGMTNGELHDAIDFTLKFRPALAARIPGYKQTVRGKLIGVVDVVACHSIESELLPESSWKVGPWCIVVDRPRPCAPVLVSGRLGLFDIPDSLIRYA